MERILTLTLKDGNLPDQKDDNLTLTLAINYNLLTLNLALNF